MWIPITERTPDKDGMYLVTIYNRGVCLTSVDTWLNERQEWMFREIPVVAWMALPEPYDMDKEDTK